MCNKCIISVATQRGLKFERSEPGIECYGNDRVSVAIGVNTGWTAAIKMSPTRARVISGRTAEGLLSLLKAM